MLCPSPLTRAAAWGRLPDELEKLGHSVAVPDPTTDDHPPYAARWIATCAQLAATLEPGPVGLVAHSGAGPLLPRLGAALAAGGRAVTAYVFLDASLPRQRPGNRLDLLASEDEDWTAELGEHLRAGGQFPEWTDADLAAEVPDPAERATLVAAIRPRSLEFFTEPLPTSGDGEPGGWPDAPVGYLLASAAYESRAAIAAQRGWPTVEHRVGHFTALTDPTGTAQALARLLDKLGNR
jgi:hypothetical protein